MEWQQILIHATIVRKVADRAICEAAALAPVGALIAVLHTQAVDNIPSGREC